MARLTRKKLEAMIEASYVKHARGKTISIMKIGNVFKDATEAILSSLEVASATPENPTVDVQGVLEAKMPEIVARYCEPA